MDWLSLNSGHDITVPMLLNVPLRKAAGEPFSALIEIDRGELRQHAERGPLMNRLRSHAAAAALAEHPDCELAGEIERVLQ